MGWIWLMALNLPTPGTRCLCLCFWRIEIVWCLQLDTVLWLLTACLLVVIAFRMWRKYLDCPAYRVCLDVFLCSLPCILFYFLTFRENIIITYVYRSVTNSDCRRNVSSRDALFISPTPAATSNETAHLILVCCLLTFLKCFYLHKNRKRNIFFLLFKNNLDYMVHTVLSCTFSTR